MKVKNYPDINSLHRQDESFWNGNAKELSEDKPNVHKERRSHDRIPANMEARFQYGNRFYAGKITNVSESGMFIHTDMALPRSSTMEVIVMIGKEVVRLPATVRRTVNNLKKNTSYKPGGIGVELHKSSPQYLSFVNKLKYS
jgi:hypothetical protein